MELLYQLGFFGPIVLFIMSLGLMFYFSKNILDHCVGLFVVLYFFTMGLNRVLKKIFKQPRPRGGIAINYLDKLKNDRFGMPSGHANTAMFSFVFTLLYFKNVLITSVFSVILLLTFIQRIKFHKHSLTQVCWGAIIGGFSAELCYYICQHLKDKN